MQRFFVATETLSGDQVTIGGETARQISRVLRMQPGDEVCLLDGSGWEYRVRLSAFGRDEVTGEVVERTQGAAEPRHKVTLYLALLNKAEKFEWALQKCTELGAAAFVPVRAARSITDVPGKAKLERWQRIIQEAAEQSGRAIVPPLHEAMTLAQAMTLEGRRLSEAIAGEHIALMPALGSGRTLAKALAGLQHDKGTAAIFIGPEGGFTEEEVERAEAAGLQTVTLGPRTLRAETAAVAALTMAMVALGEMGS
jgi:16S rRNA (uracil1498-N3)-methyltransferase